MLLSLFTLEERLSNSSSVHPNVHPRIVREDPDLELDHKDNRTKDRNCIYSFSDAGDRELKVNVPRLIESLECRLENLNFS